MTPHLVKWQAQFQNRGFTVVEVDHGGFDRLADVEAHIEEAGINFPMLYDVGGRVCRRFGVREFPTAYLVGRDGKVIWGGHPLDTEKLEREIEAALGQKT